LSSNPFFGFLVCDHTQKGHIVTPSLTHLKRFWPFANVFLKLFNFVR
jgi:hypothetical protein